MQHASDTNRKDRAHRKARREKFNGNYSEDAMLKSGGSESIEFPELPEELVAQERERIRVRHAKRKKNRTWILSIVLVLALITIITIYITAQGS